MDNATGVTAESSIHSSLLHRLRAGQADAWRTFVQLYGELVYGWCRQAGLGPEDAGDAAQEVFRAVLTNLSFRRDRPGATFRGWLWTITRNKVADHRRRAAREAMGAGGSDAQRRLADLQDQNTLDEDAPSEPNQLAGVVQQALARIRQEFTDSTWKAFMRVTVAEEPAADVASALGQSGIRHRHDHGRLLRRLAPRPKPAGGTSRASSQEGPARRHRLRPTERASGRTHPPRDRRRSRERQR